MRSPRDVIIRPIVSEKSYAGLEAGSYTFLVDPRANKTEIKEAIQAIWEVRVISVNTLNRRGKLKRRGYIRDVPIDPSGRPYVYDAQTGSVASAADRILGRR